MKLTRSGLRAFIREVHDGEWKQSCLDTREVLGKVADERDRLKARLVELEGVNLVHDCAEAESTIERQGRRVAELEARLKSLETAADCAYDSGLTEGAVRVRELEAQLADADGPMVSHSVHETALLLLRRADERVAGLEQDTAEMQRTVADLRRELERVQGEKDALEAQIDRFRDTLRQQRKALGAHEWETNSDTIERLKADAELGRLVRGMPEGVLIRLNTDKRWGYARVATWQTVNHWRDTPEEALRVAGVGVETQAGEIGGGGAAVEGEQAEQREGVRS